MYAGTSSVISKGKYIAQKADIFQVTLNKTKTLLNKTKA